MRDLLGSAIPGGIEGGAGPPLAGPWVIPGVSWLSRFSGPKPALRTPAKRFRTAARKGRHRAVAGKLHGLPVGDAAGDRTSLPGDACARRVRPTRHPSETGDRRSQAFSHSGATLNQFHKTV